MIAILRQPIVRELLPPRFSLQAWPAGFDREGFSGEGGRAVGCHAAIHCPGVTVWRV
jgi:hypothetical protein